ncbi:unnamed protein product, partial [Didymodactylos carnosus]
TPSYYDKHVITKQTLDGLNAFNRKVEAYSLLLKEYNEHTPPTSSSSVLSQPLTPTKEIDLDDFIFGSQSATTNSSHTEFDLYTKEQEIDRTDCPLNWWKSNSKKYPVISKIAMKYLCIQDTIKKTSIKEVETFVLLKIFKCLNKSTELKYRPLTQITVQLVELQKGVAENQNRLTQSEIKIRQGEVRMEVYEKGQVIQAIELK